MNDFHPLPVDLPVTHAQPSQIYAKRAIWAVVALLLVGGSARALMNSQEAKALETYTSATLERTVLTTKATPGKLEQTLRLPTTLRGNSESVIYARTSGYIAAWHKGIGDYVKQGELLATIDTPEQEHQLAEARAEREQIAARTQLAKTTLARWEALSQSESAISAQDLDEKRSALRQGEADLNAAQANVKRLENLENYRNIVAPFTGIITRRSIEVGDYITVGSKELFALTQTDPLRSTIWVPQAYADNLATGTEITINLREQQGRNLNARIERIAGGIDPSTRSRQVDLILPNADATLLPGAYAEVVIPVTSSIETLVTPSATLIIRDQNQRIAVVESDNTISFRTIKLGRDLGRDVEVLEGISKDDLLVVNPPDQLVENEVVKTRDWRPAAPASR
jgi:multidrug efflux system membrane fusion protein